MATSIVRQASKGRNSPLSDGFDPIESEILLRIAGRFRLCRERVCKDQVLT